MLEPKDLNGICAMMPAFTTNDGDRVDATMTVNTETLSTAVDKIIKDGVDIIATTGTFGEFYSLLWEEQKVLIKATVEAVQKRVPLFIGCTSLNTREVLKKMQFIREAGADGVITGVPFYMPLTGDNAAQFYLDIADAFPDLAIMIYHNPPYHRATIPVGVFKELVTRRNIVAMKDSHRNVDTFCKLMDILEGRIKVFVRQVQLYPYALLGAAGCWSTQVWMGPWPLLSLRDACNAGDWERARKISRDIGLASVTGYSTDPNWRELSVKLSVNEAGYCFAGPLRPPVRRIPDKVIEEARKRGQRWKEMADRCRAERVSGDFARKGT